MGPGDKIDLLFRLAAMLEKYFPALFGGLGDRMIGHEAKRLYWLEMAKHQAEADRERLLQGESRVAFQNNKIELIEDSQLIPAPLQQSGAADATDAVRRITQTVLEDEARKQANLLSVISAAGEYAQGSHRRSKSSSEIAEDWIFKWRSGAEEVSDADMRHLWARLLLGELDEPGSFSLRTLALASTLSSEDARLIGRVAPLAINGEIVLADEGALSRHGIDFASLLLLEELGILQGANGAIASVLTVRPGRSGIKLRIGLHFLLCYPPRGTTAQSGRAYRLTTLGKELLKLSDPVDMPEDYIARMIEPMRHQGWSFKKVVESRTDNIVSETLVANYPAYSTA